MRPCLQGIDISAAYKAIATDPIATYSCQHKVDLSKQDILAASCEKHEEIEQKPWKQKISPLAVAWNMAQKDPVTKTLSSQIAHRPMAMMEVFFGHQRCIAIRLFCAYSYLGVVGLQACQGRWNEIAYGDRSAAGQKPSPLHRDRYQALSASSTKFALFSLTQYVSALLGSEVQNSESECMHSVHALKNYGTRQPFGAFGRKLWRLRHHMSCTDPLRV